MYKTIITGVAGREATDTEGRHLQIISNVQVYPGAVVYTDGKVIYGYDIPATQEYIRRTKEEITADIVFFGVQNEGGMYAFNVTGSMIAPFNLFRTGIPAVTIPAPPDDLIPWWSGRPPYFNSNGKAFSIRGSYNTATVYGTGQTAWQLSNKNLNGALLLDATDTHMVWQMGNYCETWETIQARRFSYATRTEEYDDDYELERIVYNWVNDAEDDTPATYDVTTIYDAQDNEYATEQEATPTFSQTGNHNDLRIVITTHDGETVDTIYMRSAIRDILSLIMSEVTSMQYSNPPAGFPQRLYPPDPPAPVLLSYALGYVPVQYGYGNPYGVMSDSGGENQKAVPYLWLNVPADMATGYGGNPMEYIDWSDIDDYSEAGIRPLFGWGGLGNDWRLIRNVDYSNGVLSYDLLVKARLIANLPTYAVLDETVPDPDPSDPDVHGVETDPPMRGDVTMRNPHEIIYQGYYHITGNTITQTARYIFNNNINRWYLPEPPEYTIDDEYYMSDVEEPRKGGSYTWGRYSWDVQTRSLKYNGTDTGDTYDFVKKVIQTDGGDIVLAVENTNPYGMVHPQGYIYIYKDGRRIYSIVPWWRADDEETSDYVVNDVFNTIRDIGLYTGLDSALANIPYYSADNP